MKSDHSHLLSSLRSHARPLDQAASVFHEILDRMNDARIVCIGEASHGTHEFYRIRAELTKRLITDYGFTAVATESDWPDANRVNRYVHGWVSPGADTTSESSLRGFERFPSWMWRNTVVRDFVEWLRRHNDGEHGVNVCAGFYGIDLYSLFRSIDSVVDYLQSVDPNAARRARERYACFDHFSPDPVQYGYAAGLGIAESCENEVVRQLVELRRKAGEYARPADHPDQRGRTGEADEYFFAEQNARLVRNAEHYYRTMYTGSRAASWNLRDTHMADTIDALLQYLNDRDGQAKIVVWAHNSHLGDARATEMSQRHRTGPAEINLGQLLRERYPNETFHLGFTTYAGTVLAASDWEGPHQVKVVREGLRDSYEELFHDLGRGDFYLPLQVGDPPRGLLLHAGERLERAIGVIYLPETERQSHYFFASLPDQFDGIIHVDHTSALQPLDRAEIPSPEPETYPSTV